MGAPGADPPGGAPAGAVPGPRVALEQVTLAPLERGDWPAASRIYAAGIDGGNATFEAAAPTWEEFSRWREGCPGLIARGPGGRVLGWAALSRAFTRQVYRGVGEVSIYVDPALARRGVGSRLLGALIEASERAGFWTLEAGIFPENEASIALHRRFGFGLVGVRSRLGMMPDGRWRDVLLYERRSTAVGRPG